MSSLRIPILLLKTKSIPSDSYEELFSSPTSLFAPIFMPVLEHKPNVHNLEQVKNLLREGELKGKYGGMIFTSQRAVEGFAQAVQELEGERNLTIMQKNSALGYPDKGLEATQSQPQSCSPPNSPAMFPLYTVGPATSRTLTTLISNSHTILSPLRPKILGSDTGNGEALAKYILEHYRILFPSVATSARPKATPESNSAESDHPKQAPSSSYPPLLFLVGEQRRDIIPRTLTSPSLPPAQQIQVDELVVYETGVMETFPAHLDRALRTCQRSPTSVTSSTSSDSATEIAIPDRPAAAIVVVVVFSPTGCAELLHRLDLLNNAQRRPPPPSQSPPPPPPTTQSTAPPPPPTRYVIATIGPTTYAHLETEFGVKADVCAEKPSPEGVRVGVKAYLRGQGVGVGGMGSEG